MDETWLPELKPDQVEELCENAERSAREHILLKIPSREIHDLIISVDAEGLKPLTFNVDVEITLSPASKKCDVKKLAKEATKKAFTVVEEYLRKITG